MRVPDTTVVAAELWLLPKDGHELELSERLIIGSSPAGDLLARQGSTGGLLAQSACESMAPAVHSFDDNTSENGKLVDCISALPCTAGNNLRGVLVLCQRFGSEGRGAVEVWARDDREELGLRDSYFANLELIARISPYLKFPRSAGLPGQTWDSRTPQLMGNLHRNVDFMRATAAKSDGLSTGLGIPVLKTEHELTNVFVLLSSNSAPLARVYEIWEPTSDGAQLLCRTGAYGPYVELEHANKALTIDVGTDVAGQAYQAGRPMLFDELPELASRRPELTEQYGLTQAISWPVYAGNRINSVVNLLF